MEQLPDRPSRRPRSGAEQPGPDGFQYGSSPGAKYKGTLTRKYGDGTTLTVEFSDLQVALSGNVGGSITVNGQQGDYTQIGNYYFTKAPVAFWKAVLDGTTPDNVDMSPVGQRGPPRSGACPTSGMRCHRSCWPGAWATTTSSIRQSSAGRPAALSQQGHPRRPLLAHLRIERSPRSPATRSGGDWEITFASDTKAISHLQGQYRDGDVTTTIDTDVTPLSFDRISPIFAQQKGLTRRSRVGAGTSMTIDDLPGGQLDQAGNEPVTARMWRAVTTSPSTARIRQQARACELRPDRQLHRQRPAGRGRSASTCTPVIRVDFDKTATTRCTATNLGSGGGSIRPNGDLLLPPVHRLRRRYPR